MRKMENAGSVLMGLLSVAASEACQAQDRNERPNILCLVCEDISPYLGCYGDPNAVTPNLDRLAMESVRFTNMHTTVGVSSPSRFSLITGMYSAAFGANYMRTQGNNPALMPEGILPYQVVTPPYIRCYSEYMRAAGYYCTNGPKTDYQFVSPTSAWDECSNKHHWMNRPEGAPFFSIFNMGVTHESQMWERAEYPLAVNPDSLVIPPYFPDTPEVRRDLAILYSNIAEMDRQVQARIEEVRQAGLLDNTIIIWYSDNGGPIPRGKREIYETGTNVPFMIRYPDGHGAGTVDNDLHMFIDIPATILSLAGVRPPRYMHGQPFGGKYASHKARKFVYGARDRMDEKVDKQGAVYDGRFHYIKNYMPERPDYLDCSYQNNLPSLRQMYQMYLDGQLTPEQARFFEAPRPAEEFYDHDADPFELHNLIDDPAYSREIAGLKKEYDRWIRRYLKDWFIPEKESYESFCPGGVRRTTDNPVVKLRGGKARISCKTKGASLSYRLSGPEGPGRWLLYTGPVTVPDGYTLSAMASRIGYNESDEVVAGHTPSSVEKNIRKLLKGMTLEEKLGQMVQITVDDPLMTGHRLDSAKVAEVIGKYKAGSILNVPRGGCPDRDELKGIVSYIQKVSMEEIGIPCIYGLDMIHGASYLKEGTLFPQEINVAATFDPSYAEAMGMVTAYETRSAMVPWSFSPVMDLGRDPRWPRHWESWGEDPYLQGVMAVAETKGMQGTDPENVDKHHVAACIKHYLGYGVPVSGKDRTPAIISDNDLKEKFFHPFKECIENGALSLMVNSSSINGVPVHASHRLLTEWVKEGLDWDGMIVTDWADINNLYKREMVASDLKEALELGINAGIDMIMDPQDPSIVIQLAELVKEGRIKMSRIDDAVSRILRLKFRLGLFEEPVWDCSDESYPLASSKQFIDESYSAALESEVLLKNDGVLPLKEGSRILVTGPCANSMRSLNGGWTYSWQGAVFDDINASFNTIYKALSNRFGSDNVSLCEGVSFSGSNWQSEDASHIADAVRAAAKADVVVACIGENSYCETPGNIDDLTLSDGQIELVKALYATGKPVVLILNEGRPRIINSIVPDASAIVDIMLPGNYGADALAALLSGDENFSGRLPFTYSKYVHALHTYDYKVSEKVNKMAGAYDYDAIMDVQWSFGTGLSYTSFEYSGLKCDKEEFASGDELTFTLDVTNTGSLPGKHSVLLYSSDLVASLVPDARRLRAFTKLYLEPGQTQTVTMSVPADDLAFVGTDGKWHLEAGDFDFSAGQLSVRGHCTRDSVRDFN